MQSAATRAVNAALEQNIERKICYYNGASTVTSAGVVISLTSNLVRGDASINEATGRLIKPKKLDIRMVWSIDVQEGYNTVRALVFRWADASSPVATGLLHQTGVFAPLSPLSWLNHQKITVLFDETVALFDHGGKVDTHFRHVRVDPGRKPIQLPLNGAGTVPQMDGLYLLLISDDALTPTPVVDVYSALEFTDA